MRLATDRKSSGRDFLPAAGRAPLALYDAAVAAGMRERAFRGLLVEQVVAGSHAPEVIDVGCGTGTLAIALSRAGARVKAIDPDAAALRRARAKDGAERVEWWSGKADELPVDEASADRLVLSLVLHHLRDETKLAALREARRVLRPRGSLHVADWTVPGDLLMGVAFRGLQMIDGRATTASLGRGELPRLAGEAGFAQFTQLATLRTAFGRLALSASYPD